MSFPRYAKYKDSGVAWLGEVPAHWGVCAVRRAVDRIEQGWSPECEATPADDDTWGVLKAGCLNNGFFDASENKTLPPGLAPMPEYEVCSGDVLMSRASGSPELVGSVALVKETRPKLMLSDKIFRIRLATEISPAHFVWMMSSRPTRSQIEQALSGGNGLANNLPQSVLLAFQLAVPPRQEQDAIASFLDRETTKIDALVAEQEQLITLLKEKRQAVISHAVTKGLDPSVPMKASGVEWLGEVPAHWSIGRIKHVVASFEQGWSPQCENFPVESESDWGVLKVGCVNGGIFKPEENKALPADLMAIPALGVCLGDLLISRANTRELVGSAAVVPADHQNLLLCDKLYRLRLTPSLCLPGFLSLFLSTELARGQIELAATGASSSMLNIAQSTILEMSVPMPPVAEQATLLSTVDQRTLEQDQLISEAVLSIELLKERRAALISAAVTGQIDVSGLASEPA